MDHKKSAADDDVETAVDTAEQLETRKKKKKEDKSEEKKAGETAVKAPRKRPSTSSFLSYVVMSDTLASLDAGDKLTERNPDDDATLIEIHVVAALAAKKSKLQKETPPAPSESEIDLGVFSVKHGNLLEKLYAASGSQGMKSGKGTRKVDISKITPPTSPPSRIFGLSPPHTDLGKRKEDDVAVEQVGEGGAGAGGDGGDGGRGEGVDVEVQSSETTPHHTIYTKVVRGSGEGGASGTRHSPEYEHVQGGSWDTHNSACADLPHAPRWNLTQGSRMTDLGNCREFFSLSLPPAGRLFQKRRNRMDLLDDHIHAGVNFFATSQEIARGWQLMGGTRWNLRPRRRRLLKREKNSALRRRVCRKGLRMRRRNLLRRNSLMLTSRKSGKLLANEPTANGKREHEYIQRIAKQEAGADCKWLLARAVPLISERIAKSDELAKYMFELGQAAYNCGRKDGYGEGRATTVNNEKDYHFELYKQDCIAVYTTKRQEYEFIEFGVVKLLRSCLGKLMLLKS
ncbi:hypothetical protein Hanom_Chr01g00031861 [Helianthus anomalus]